MNTKSFFRPVLAALILIAAFLALSASPAQADDLWAWGYNASGQVGDGTLTNVAAPENILIPGKTIVAVQGGSGHTVALTADGLVYAWGDNSVGQLGTGDTTPHAAPVQVPGLSRIIRIAAGLNHSLALDRDGNVWAWGYNNQGQTGVDPSTASYVPTPTKVQISNIMEIAAGDKHSVALDSGGNLWVWGGNTWGEGCLNSSVTMSNLPQSTGYNNISHVTAGMNHTLYIDIYGNIWSCGRNDHGQLGIGNTNSVFGPQQITTFPATETSAPVVVAAGGYHSAALFSDGTVWTWGMGSSGQLGNGATNDSSVPVMVSGIPSAQSVSLGLYHTFALMPGGSVYAWGANNYSQLGVPNETSSTVVSPEKTSFTNAVVVAHSSGSHSLVLTADPARAFDDSGIVLPYTAWVPAITDQQTTNETGQQITLPSSGSVLDRADIMVYSGLGVWPQGTVNAELRLYGNDGTGGAPGTLIWDSGVVPQMPIDGIDDTITFQIPNVSVPQTFIWTLTLGNLQISNPPDSGFYLPACYGSLYGTTGPLWSRAAGQTAYQAMTATANLGARFYTSADPYTIDATAGQGGTISPSGMQNVSPGSNQTFTITALAGYAISNVLVDGTSVGAVGTYTFSNVQANHTITASFTSSFYTITAGAYDQSGNVTTNGTITPMGVTNVASGGGQVYTMAAAPGYIMYSLFIDNSVAYYGTTPMYTFTNVTANHTINAYFMKQTFTITASAGSNGAISPGTTSVTYGSSQTFTFTPLAGYSVAGVEVDGSSVGSPSSYTFNNVLANHTISVTFSPNPAVIITATATAGGTMTPVGNVNVLSGANQTFTMTPNAGYRVDSVTVDGVTIWNNLQSATYTFNDVVAPHSISAVFVLDTYTITSSEANSDGSPSVNGSITPLGTTTVSYGGSLTFTITPTTGYVVSSCLVDGTQVGPQSSYTFSNIAANHTIAVYFKKPLYTITATAGTGGTISPAGTTFYQWGQTTVFAITPNSPAYTIQDVQVDGTSVGPVSAYTFVNIQANHTINVTFYLRPIWTVTATAGPNGSIAPPGVSNVYNGDSITYTMAPNVAYRVSDVQVDGTSIGPVNTYTFFNVTTNHTINVNFVLDTLTITASLGNYAAQGTLTPSGVLTVPRGQSTTFNITVVVGYHVDSIVLDGVNVGSSLIYTIPNIQANHTLVVNIAPNPTYYVTGTIGAGSGTITPSSTTGQLGGTSPTYQITPATGQVAYSVLIDGAQYGNITSFTFANIQSNHTIVAYFKLITYTVVASAGPNGTISNPGTNTYNYGTTQTYTMTPNSGYHVLDVTVDGNDAGAVTSYTFTNITANHTISVTFAANPTFTINASYTGSGTISPSGSVTVPQGANQKFTMTPASGYRVDSVTIDGTTTAMPYASSYTFSNVQAGHTFVVNFVLDVWTITASVNGSGTINPSGTVTVNHGSNQTFTMTPNSGHTVRSVFVDGSNYGAITTYTFTSVSANHTITVYFN